MVDRSFGFNPAKRLLVLEERRIDLLAMAQIFEDADRLDYEDARRDYGEVRRITIGEVEGRLFTVVYTPRGEVTWLITAWAANRRDRRRYYGA